jgi:hypothetical protein
VRPRHLRPQGQGHPGAVPQQRHGYTDVRRALSRRGNAVRGALSRSRPARSEGSPTTNAATAGCRSTARRLAAAGLRRAGWCLRCRVPLGFRSRAPVLREARRLEILARLGYTGALSFALRVDPARAVAIQPCRPSAAVWRVGDAGCIRSVGRAGVSLDVVYVLAVLLALA